MKTTALTLSYHGLNRALSRGFAVDVVSTLKEVGNDLSRALDAVAPILNNKILKFWVGGRQYSVVNGRIKTIITIENRVYVVGLNPDRTPTVITTWHKEV
mgnify:CR=1 FL=1